MAKHVVLAQSEIAAAALESARKRLRSDYLDANDAVSIVVVRPVSIERSSSGTDLFHFCAEAIEEALRLGGSPGGPVVLVDAVRPARLTAVSESASWDHLIAMLILAFPDVRWMFGVVQGEESGFPSRSHSIASITNTADRDPLFDPTGLREWVRRRTMDILRRSGVAGANAEWLPRRVQLAASIDDESSYAYYHAYAAYRYGFRSDVVTSWATMQMLFGSATLPNGEYTLLFEDMRLNFPDKPAAIHLTDFNERRRACPGLSVADEKAQWRFVVSTGQTHGDDDVVAANQKHLDHRSYGRGQLLWKPVGGILDLWERAGLTKELGGGTRRAGNADDFEWPFALNAEEKGRGHAAPGKLMLIAEILLRRAEAIGSGPTSVESALRAAVHAADAIELSTGRTPTTALGGMVLRQELEVKAECAFVGAGFHIGTERRTRELDAELNSVTVWFHEDVRRKATLDARVSTLSRLVLIFRNAGKLEEETACLNALRQSNRSLRSPEWKGIGNLLVWLFLWSRHGFIVYAEWLMGSLDRLILMNGVWIASLALIAWRLCPSKPITTFAAQAASWFLGTSPLTDWSVLTPLSWVGTSMGVFHLGVLVSFLYSLIARK